MGGGPGKNRRSMASRSVRESFSGGATNLGTMRLAERALLADMLEGFFGAGAGAGAGAGGMCLLTGDAGSGKSELAKHVLKCAGAYGPLLIECKIPKAKGIVKDLDKFPCLELSLVLKGLLAKVSPPLPRALPRPEGTLGQGEPPLPPAFLVLEGLSATMRGVVHAHISSGVSEG